jgi:hypothetical protein
LGAGFFAHKRIISAVKRIKFVSDRMSYIILRARLFHIIVPNIHCPMEDKTDGVKDSFYEEMEHDFNKFPKYYMNTLLGYFNAKSMQGNNSKSTIKDCMKSLMKMELEQ